VAPSSSRFCTHLVTVSILRTIKFLTALSHVKHIVTPEWIEQSSRANRFLGELANASDGVGEGLLGDLVAMCEIS